MRLPISTLSAAGIGFGTSGVRAKVDALTDRVCVAYTLAFLQHLSRPSGKGAGAVALGHDLRPSSPRIARACATATRMAGWDVAFTGAVPTPALAHYAMQKGIPAIVVTGSHIPFDRNGIKFYAAEGEILKADEAAISAATVELDDAAFDGDALRDPAPLPPRDPAGEELFVERYLGFFPAGMLQGRRIGVYQHSSVARDLIPRVLAALGAEVVALRRTDTFVPVDTEAVSDADQRDAHAWAAEHRLDAIVSTDGDADRPLVSDEKGTWFRGDVVGMLCAGYLGAHTVVTPVSSNTAVDRCGKFRKVVRTRIGSPFVIDAMNAAVRAGEHPVAGYEANGGFLLASPVERPGPDGRVGRLEALPTRDALLPILSVLAMAAERGGPVSGVMAGLPARFTKSDRLQEFDTALSRDLLARLSADPAVLGGFFSPVGEIADVNRVDGLRVTLVSGDIVHLRPSGNAPELRCYAEADTAERAAELCGWGLRAAGEAARAGG
jgi:phosphomannomutase